MLDVVALVSGKFTLALANEFQRAFSHSDGRYLEVIENASRLAVERIGVSNALYHNFEHTILVTQVGWEILKGKRVHLKVDAADAMHFLLACLMHDIGYVRGICAGDTSDRVVINEVGDTIQMSIDASDAALAPYHVDRSKLFIRERAALIDFVDGERIARAVELTRFPVPNDADHAETDTEAELVESRRPDRTAGGPLLSAKMRGLVLRVRGDGPQQAARLFEPHGLDPQLPEVLLELDL